MVSVRLPQELEAQFEAVAKQQHTTKTTLIRQAIIAFLDKLKQQEEFGPYELGADLFGVYEGGADLSAQTKSKTLRLLHEKHPHS